MKSRLAGQLPDSDLSGLTEQAGHYNPRPCLCIPLGIVFALRGGSILLASPLFFSIIRVLLGRRRLSLRRRTP